MDIKVPRIITGIGLALVITLLFAGCENITPTPSPTPLNPDDSLLPTEITTSLSDWDGADVIYITQGTQGQIDDVRIGLSATRAENYIDKNGDMQRGMTADIHLFLRDGLTEYKTVYLGQTFKFGEYSFFIREIRPTNLKADSPDGASGGGLISLLCLPTKDMGNTTTTAEEPTPPTENLDNNTPEVATGAPAPLLAPIFTLETFPTNNFIQLPALGGVPPYTWSIWSGSLPSGLVLSSSGVITGDRVIGQESGSSPQFMVTDSASTTVMVQHFWGSWARQDFYFGYVRAGYNNPAEQPGCKNNPAVAYTDSIFNFIPCIQGGVQPLTFLVPGGLPEGLKCESDTGVICGTPSKASAGQVYYIIVYGKDSAGHALDNGLYITAIDR
jgi:hypothetical protein